MTPKEIVMKHVNEIWELDKQYDDGLKVEDFPMLPGGTRIMDKDGEVLYFYDLLKQEIVERSAAGEVRTPLYLVTKSDPMGYYPGGL